MSDVSKIVLTTVSTVLVGVLVFILGRIIEKFMLEPLQDYKKCLANIAYSFIFYADIYSNPVVASVEDKAEVSKKIRTLASELFVKTDQIFFYDLFFRLGVIPDCKKSIEAARKLIGFSNFSFNPTPDEQDERRREIKELLKIKN